MATLSAPAELAAPPVRTAIDSALHFTEHFVAHGFAVLKHVIERSVCAEAAARVRQMVNNGLPPEQWNSKNTEVLHKPYFQGATDPEAAFDRLFEQPQLRQAIDDLFGGPRRWNGERNYYLFIKPFNETAAAKLAPRGHIDFPDQQIPPLYRGFMFQIALADGEPFGGNLTVYPGTHRLIQQALIADPQARHPGPLIDAIPQPEPFEFVGEAGDVCFLHHLMFHAGNHAHGQKHLPRIAIHGEAFRNDWLTEVNPAGAGLGPWERSLSLNGPLKTTADLEEANTLKRQQYLQSLREKKDVSRY